MRRLIPYLARRFLFLIPQLFVATVLSFALIKLLPGNPVLLMLGLAASSPEAVAAMEKTLGLDQPLLVQYGLYISNVLQGNWGRSWFTRQPVLEDLGLRLPATLELITISLTICVFIGIVVGMLAALRPTGVVNRGLTWYGFLAGAIPDFWMGLLLVFFFFALWKLVPAPLGQLSISVAPPPALTRVVLIDSILAGDGAAFKDHLLHLVLPVLTLVLVYTAPILKITAATVDKMRHEPFIVAARAYGVKERILYWYMLRNSLAPVITTIGVMYAFLLGGAVLVETVFAWNGFGQYAVESVLRKDLFPIQGFLLIAAIFTMLVYLVVDILYAFVDPRVKL